jgi:signal transduction histidine kinase
MSGEKASQDRLSLIFLSHEVRTPLNTLIMGLDLLMAHNIFKISPEDNLSHSMRERTQSANPANLQSQPASGLSQIDRVPLIASEIPPADGPISNPIELGPQKENQIKDALDIMESMRQSCETAICTLNDVLLYDKIEGGTMVLEKRLIPVTQLVTQAVQPFFIQARSNEVELTISESLESLRGCVLEVDVNKISQVLRNFLSNSLKFTPSHGRVTVKAYRVEVF